MITLRQAYKAHMPEVLSEYLLTDGIEKPLCCDIPAPCMASDTLRSAVFKEFFE